MAEDTPTAGDFQNAKHLKQAHEEYFVLYIKDKFLTVFLLQNARSKAELFGDPTHNVQYAPALMLTW